MICFEKWLIIEKKLMLSMIIKEADVSVAYLKKTIINEHTGTLGNTVLY